MLRAIRMSVFIVSSGWRNYREAGRNPSLEGERRTCRRRGCKENTASPRKRRKERMQAATLSAGPAAWIGITRAEGQTDTINRPPWL